MNVRQELVDRGCLYFSGEDDLPQCQFVGISGNHLAGYNNFDPALPDVSFLKQLTRELVRPFVGRSERIGVVMTAATGSIPLAVLSAIAIMEAEGRDDVRSVWADKVEGLDDVQFALIRPGFARAVGGTEDGGRTLIVDDMINRQFTIRKLIRTARAAGGVVAGVASVAANSGVTADGLEVPKFMKLCDVQYKTWTPEECIVDGPCGEGVPIVVDDALGHGAHYQRLNPDYLGGYINLLPAQV